VVKTEEKCYSENSCSSEKNQPEALFFTIKRQNVLCKISGGNSLYGSCVTIPNASAILAGFCSNFLGIRGNLKLQKPEMGRKTPASLCPSMF